MIRSKEAHLSIEHGDIFNVRIVDVVLNPCVLPDTTHADTMCAVAIDVLY